MQSQESVIPESARNDGHRYDASSSRGVVGANAPLPWVEASLQALLSGAAARQAAHAAFHTHLMMSASQVMLVQHARHAQGAVLQDAID